MRTAVYVLLCEDEAWYVGVAEDPYHRFKQHQAGKGAVYTRLYPPRYIAHLFWCETKEEALHLEDAMTYVMQQSYLKVAGGRWTMPSPSGRGREWTEAELDFRKFIHEHFGWTKTPQLQRPKKPSKARSGGGSHARRPPRQALVSDIRKMAYSATMGSDVSQLLGEFKPTKKKEHLSTKEIVERWRQKCAKKETK